MKFSIKDFFSKCDQIRRKLAIWSHLLKKSLMENFLFCTVSPPQITQFSSINMTSNVRQYNVHYYYRKKINILARNGKIETNMTKYKNTSYQKQVVKCYLFLNFFHYINKYIHKGPYKPFKGLSDV